jgi:hypothetical protein
MIIASTFKGSTLIPCIEKIKTRSLIESTQKCIYVDSIICDNIDIRGKWLVSMSGDLDESWNVSVNHLGKVVQYD